MQWDNIDIQKIDIGNCGICRGKIPRDLVKNLERSEEELICALKEFCEFKKHVVYLEGTQDNMTLKIMCPVCNIRSQGKTPLEDETRPLGSNPREQNTQPEDE